MHVGRYSVGGKEVGELRAGRIVLMHVGERNAHGVVDRGELWLQLQRSLEFAAALVEAFVPLVVDSMLLKDDGDAAMSGSSLRIRGGDEQPFARDLFSASLYCPVLVAREYACRRHSLQWLSCLAAWRNDSIASQRFPDLSPVECVLVGLEYLRVGWQTRLGRVGFWGVESVDR